ncbi:5-formyltetrahydrofolate cyclo-ligase [Bowmanella denitrificans]|uniref:5-formyltetrahydrofolate cyclo-ligase n=1 Tax=Bowmanella denitrificans TaxID=366582 RepID=A0ABN0XE08_9ALTE
MKLRNTHNPQALRQALRRKRQALSPQQQQQASAALLEQCQRLASFQQASHVALYLANDGELDPAQVIQHCWKAGKAVYLPVLHPFCAGNLLFMRYQADSLMIANRYGIAEPRLECPGLCPVGQLDMLFTPLVGFNQQGNRMGMGGGYYDRTLAPLKRQPANVEVVGLAHNCQQCDSLPVQPWDIPMHKIITPDKIFHFQSQ